MPRAPSRREIAFRCACCLTSESEGRVRLKAGYHAQCACDLRSGVRYRLPEAATFEGAVSGMNIMAQSPAAVANSKYQAGASALPVTSVSQATMSWAVPPNIAIATA